MLVIVVAAIATACGGGSTTQTPTSTVPPPTATARPAATAVAAPTPAVATPQPAATAVTSPTSAAPASSDAKGPGLHDWLIEDIDTGTKPALALTSDGVPYVAYMLEAMPGFVKNAVRNGDSWEVTTVADGYFYGPLDIAIGPDDTAHITYHDHQHPSQFQTNLGDAVHAFQAAGGSDWEIEPVFDDGHDGWDTRITVDAQGRPHISAIDPVEFDGAGVEYYGRDDAGKWTVESVGSAPLTYKWATSIAVDPAGNPHISYYDEKIKHLLLASRDGGWSISTIDSDGDTGLFASLVIDGEGRFHLSYLQRETPSSGIIKYATRGAGDTEWEIRAVDALDNLEFGFLGARNITSVVVDSKGNPWIVYSDEKVLKLAIWTGSGWQLESVVDAGAGTLGQLVSLKLDSDDRPHIAYFEVTSQRPLNGVIKYARGTPAG